VCTKPCELQYTTHSGKTLVLSCCVRLFGIIRRVAALDGTQALFPPTYQAKSAVLPCNRPCFGAIHLQIMLSFLKHNGSHRILDNNINPSLIFLDVSILQRSVPSPWVKVKRYTPVVCFKSPCKKEDGFSYRIVTWVSTSWMNCLKR
jgi:hypothetical protein